MGPWVFVGNLSLVRLPGFGSTSDLAVHWSFLNSWWCWAACHCLWISLVGFAAGTEYGFTVGF
jgi:hypothetical protein